MTPRYKLRTLLILLAVLPPLLWIGWGKYQAWKAEQELQAQTLEVQDGGSVLLGGLPRGSSDLEHSKGRDPARPHLLLAGLFRWRVEFGACYKERLANS